MKKTKFTESQIVKAIKEHILIQMAAALREHTSKIIEGSLWLENYYPRKINNKPFLFCRMDNPIELVCQNACKLLLSAHSNTIVVGKIRLNRMQSMTAKLAPSLYVLVSRNTWIAPNICF
jgi:hypothetical protein